MSQDSRLRPSWVTGRWTEAGQREVTPRLKLADHLWFRCEMRTWTKYWIIVSAINLVC